MKSDNIRKVAIAGILVAIAVLGGFLSFPVLGSRCAPVQHMVNVFCAVLLGPWWGLGVAFAASLLRNLMGVGSILAFPGSMCGALVCGLLYRWTRKLWATLLGEAFGTGILGGLLSYPLAIAFMGQSVADLAFYAYVGPFLISTTAGCILAALVVYPMERTGTLQKFQMVKQ